MTDRSSEERSRFEKDLREWFENRCNGFSGAFPLAKDRFGDYYSVLTGNVWILCSQAFAKGAALEDRQEAAPLHRVVIDNPLAQFTELSLEMCVHSQGGDFQDRMRTFPSAKFHMWCDLGRMLQNRGVPSEATPSKENETVAALRELNFALAEEVARLGKKSGPRVIAAQSKLDRLDWTASDQVFTGPTPEMQAVRRKYHEAAPAPEVQGTPTKKSCLYCNEAFSGCSMCRTQVCATCGEPVQNGVTCHEGKVISGIRTVPVETPQKETPPHITTGNVLDDLGLPPEKVRALKERYENRAAPVETPQKCQFHNAPMEGGKCTYDPRTPQKETPTMPYGAGAQNFGARVQGKEPQTPEEWIDANYPVAPPKFKAALDRAFSSGETAGRRSAITENTDLLDALKLLIRALGGLDHTSGSVHLAVLNGEKVLAKCAELKEKP